MASCADRLLSLLDLYGIEVAFGVPGIHTVELYRTLPAYGIRHVTPRHEQGAGFMAYGYAFATGRPAACFLITGPGLLNAATAIAEAYSESLPMFVLASGNRRGELGLRGGALHETLDQHAVERQIAGDAHLLLEPDNLDRVVARAFASFTTSRPRPFCLQVPRDLLGHSASAAPPSRPASVHPPGPARSAIAAAAALLRGAERPLVIVGGGAWQAGQALRRLVEAAHIPVVSTNAGKGVIPEDHPLAVGSSLPFTAMLERVAEADVVLAVGTELAETDLLYCGTSLRIEGSLIRIDIDADQLTASRNTVIGILSDARLALEALSEELAGAPLPAREHRGAWTRVVTDTRGFAWSVEAPKHKAILDRLATALDDDAIVCADSTQLAYTGNHYYPSRSPRTWLFPNGYGTLGSALPAAIGAWIGVPHRQVVAIVGDGSFLYSAPELAAAVEVGAPIPILLWNNLGYGEIRDAMVAEGVPTAGVDLIVPDFLAVARGFGCAAHHLRSLEDLGAVLAEAFARKVPTLIQIDAFDPMFSGAGQVIG